MTETPLKQPESAISDFGIQYPVDQDNDYGTWNAYGNQYWPADYLIDSNGNVRYAWTTARLLGGGLNPPGGPWPGGPLQLGARQSGGGGPWPCEAGPQPPGSRIGGCCDIDAP